MVAAHGYDGIEDVNFFDILARAPAASENGRRALALARLPRSGTVPAKWATCRKGTQTKLSANTIANSHTTVPDPILCAIPPIAAALC